MLDRRVDGIILLPVDESVESLYLKEVFDRGIPLVTVDRGIKSVSVDYVGTDEEQGGRLAAEHLLALGHRRLACVGASPRVANMVDRTEAFRRHAEAGGAVVEVLFADPMSGIHGPEIEAFFRLDPLPTAVMTASDNAAVKIMLHAQERGLRLPQDLSIVGYADLEFARYLSPALTTIRQPFEAIGRAAAATVLAAAAPDATAKPLRLAPELVVRSSTAPRRG
jgi:LacI family transcriptional regulator